MHPLSDYLTFLVAVKGRSAQCEAPSMGRSYIKKQFVMTEGSIVLEGNLDLQGWMSNWMTISSTPAASQSSQRPGMKGTGSVGDY